MSRTNTVERRAEIVRAMSVVMAEHGYDGATVQEIARQCDLAPGLVHYHFKSKLEILLSLIEQLEEVRQQRYLARQSGSNSDPHQDLEAFIHSMLALGADADDAAVRCWIVIGAESLRQPEVAAAYKAISAQHIKTLEEIIARCLTAKRRSSRGKRAIALGIFAAIDGALRLLVSAPSLIQSGFAAPTVVAMANGAIDSQPPAAAKPRQR